ncbi:MAG: hypothetical protein LQ350_006498 [Teloschistes chrysophthalmus]|nr:MAG: hypothetical protein LQ350_006498 [Niorma chrysophthalma]
MSGPPPHIWQRDPNAPLGSFLNPLPRVVHKRPRAANAKSSQGQKHGRSRSEGSRIVPDQQAASAGAKPTPEAQETSSSSTSSSGSISPVRPQNAKQKKAKEARHVHFEEDDQARGKADRKGTKAASPQHRTDLEDIFEYVEVHPTNQGHSRRSSASAIPGEYRPSSSQTTQTTAGQNERSGPVYMTGAMPDPPRRPHHSRNASVDSATDLHFSGRRRYSSPPPSRDSQHFYHSYQQEQQSSTPAPPSNNQRASRTRTPPSNQNTRGHRHEGSDRNLPPHRPTRPPPSSTRNFDHGAWPLCPKCKKNKATVTDYSIEECRTCISNAAREQEREAQELAKHTCAVCEDAAAKFKDRNLYFCGKCWPTYTTMRAAAENENVDVKRLRRRRSLLCMVCDEKLYTITKKDLKMCDACYMGQVQVERERRDHSKVRERPRPQPQPSPSPWGSEPPQNQTRRSSAPQPPAQPPQPTSRPSPSPWRSEPPSQTRRSSGPPQAQAQQPQPPHSSSRHAPPSPWHAPRPSSPHPHPHPAPAPPVQDRRRPYTYTPPPPPRPDDRRRPYTHVRPTPPPNHPPSHPPPQSRPPPSNPPPTTTGATTRQGQGQAHGSRGQGERYRCTVCARREARVERAGVRFCEPCLRRVEEMRGGRM